MGYFASVFLLLITALPAARAGEMIQAAAGTPGIIPDAYIVVMNDGISDSDFESHRGWAASMHNKAVQKRGRIFSGMTRMWNATELKGYSGSFDRQTIQQIANHSSATGIIFLTICWSGITIYGVDTGIDIQHPEFQGRAIWGTNQVDNVDRDQNGHGTHTAGTFAGTTFGVAKRATIVAVKVLDAQGGGRASSIISGINWCVSHARQNNLLGRAVMNLSLGGSGTRSFNQVATNAANAGIFLSVAAGNDAEDAANTSPASARGVCTVAASTEQDTRADFSNFGQIVDIYAPGDRIISAFPNNSRQVLSGTSMAAPHVAGVGAYLMALEGISATQVCDRLKRLSQPSIRNPGPRTTNRLLYNNSGV
ncbi:conserved hypothetical protein [Uncinocarpus reesii 1704]|uniref:Uncharacterized protein n=1 Tax=Uncinocarpus reesii (strain UAMH 1704) TaxID=336963 RepID=C4JTQ6_UNCRE|nr:uncharacterized protein UREG_05845 [Uncinocarpus reesii 1704]EEP81003.1 conserved hypothetical protein [Uncinocarpus reesii 1704]